MISKKIVIFIIITNKSDVTPSVLDGGRQIILANWPNYKRIICTYNNNIPVNIPGHPYVLLVLYNTLLLINQYIGNNTTKCHGGSMSDNRDLTGVFHQKISSLPKVIASDYRYFQTS